MRRFWGKKCLNAWVEHVIFRKIQTSDLDEKFSICDKFSAKYIYTFFPSRKIRETSAITKFGRYLFLCAAIGT